MLQNHSGQVGSGAEKQGVTIGNHPGISGQQVKADHDDGINKDPGQQGDIETAVKDIGAQGKGNQDGQNDPDTIAAFHFNPP